MALATNYPPSCAKATAGKKATADKEGSLPACR